MKNPLIKLIRQVPRFLVTSNFSLQYSFHYDTIFGRSQLWKQPYFKRTNFSNHGCPDLRTIRWKLRSPRSTVAPVHPFCRRQNWPMVTSKMAVESMKVTGPIISAFWKPFSSSALVRNDCNTLRKFHFWENFWVFEKRVNPRRLTWILACDIQWFFWY